ncbi:MAG: chloride channel protein [Desulfatitalea sp.]|nr:chloride channel protein [Desulfatitalea sp.]
MTAVRQRWTILRADKRLTLIALAGFVGACSGLAGVALNRCLHFMAATFHGMHVHWWGFALPAVGACLSALFLNYLLKERAGHGVPEVVQAVSRQGGRLRLSFSFSRLISSSLTIGSGGSAGPEAPVIMSGAALGSNIARLFRLDDRQRVILVGCGAAGAIGSIFNAPITGMVFTLEVILAEWRAFNIIPIAIGAVAGTEVSRLLQGNQIAFQSHGLTIHGADIVASFGVVLFATVVSTILGRSLKGMHRLAGRTPLPAWLRPAVGGALVGVIGIWLPVVLGDGYPSVQRMIEGTFTQGLFLAVLVGAAKTAATALTLGWGGSGGIFAPSLMIGSLAGVVYYRLLVQVFPAAGFSGEGCFALLGIAGLISGMQQAPLTAIFLVVEITGGYDAILPLIIVSALTSTLCSYIEPGSFYLRELIEKGIYQRPGTDARVLSDMSVAELVETDHLSISGSMRMTEFLKILEHSHSYLFPVADPLSGEYVGMVFVDRIRPYLFNPQMHTVLLVEQIMERDVPTVRPGDDLSGVLDLMAREGLSILPVVENGKFVGLLSKATLLDHYRKELIVQTGL